MLGYSYTHSSASGLAEEHHAFGSTRWHNVLVKGWFSIPVSVDSSLLHVSLMFKSRIALNLLNLAEMLLQIVILSRTSSKDFDNSVLEDTCKYLSRCFSAPYFLSYCLSKSSDSQLVLALASPVIPRLHSSAANECTSFPLSAELRKFESSLKTFNGAKTYVTVRRWRSRPPVLCTHLSTDSSFRASQSRKMAPSLSADAHVLFSATIGRIQAF